MAAGPDTGSDIDDRAETATATDGDGDDIAVRGAPDTEWRVVAGRWRLLAPALLGWIVCAWAIGAPGTGMRVAALAAVTGTIALAAAWRPGAVRARGVLRLLALSCAALVILGARIGVEEHVRAAPDLLVAAERSEIRTLHAVLQGFPDTQATGDRQRSWVRAQVPGERGGVAVLLFFDGGLDPRWGPGTRLILRGTLDRSAAGERDAFTVSVAEFESLAAESSTEGLHPSSWFETVAGELRHGLREAAARVPGAELVPGFAVGDTSLVSAELERAMLESSLTHLTAVSGANCALVTGVVLWLLARLGASRKWRICAAAAALGGFLVVVGPDSSVQRAAVMAGVMLVSGFGGKQAVALPALAAAMLVLLCADPWQALQAGFALSVAATAGILLAAAPLARALEKRLRLPRLLSLPVAVALAAQLACGPIVLLLQSGIPAIGVLANVLAAPAAPLGTALGLAAALALPLPAVVTHHLVLLASLPARWVAATAEVSAAVPLARWHWPEGWTGAILLAGCELALLLAWALRRGHLGLPGAGRVPRRAPWERAAPPPRPIRLAVAILVSSSAGVFVAITLVSPVGERLGIPSRWVMVACDIGQGDAFLLRDPAIPGEVMLVDTGDDAELLASCLERFGVSRISLLVLSHDDLDHVGALGSVLDRVDRALISPTTLGTESGEREVVRQLTRAGIPFTIGSAGAGGTLADPERAPAGPSGVEAGLSWTVLAPAEGATPAESNAASLVMRVSAGGARILLLGDTGLEEQQALLRAVGDLRADVLKVAHHGSRDQDPRLPAAVGAEWALISVGAQNRYGHPAADTLASLHRSGAGVLRTDEHGAVALSLSDDGLEPWVERLPPTGDGGRP